MGEDFFDVAWINGGKGILHGRRKDQSEVERELTEEECGRVKALCWRHEAALENLLREMAA